MKLKRSYDNFDKESDETGLECKDPSLTQQHDEPEANINNIVARYLGTGSLERHNMPPLQGDFTNAPDMQTAMNLQVEAQRAFMEQPAAIRSRFNNEAAKFVEFCSDPENRLDMYKMGLLNDVARDQIDRERYEDERKRKQDKEDAETFRKEKPNK